MSARRIALCVDDFGLHAGVNEAVLDLAGLGRLNAVSCLVGARAWGWGSRALGGVDRSQVDVGLHLDLTDVPLIDGSRHGLAGLLLRACAHQLDVDALRAEIEAQFDAFEQAMQRPPDHVDGHRHVHQLPQVREALVQVLQRRRPVPAPWLRNTRRAPAAGAWAVKERFIESLGAVGLTRLAQANGWQQNRHLLGVHDFSATVDGYGQRLEGWLHAATEGDLLMCHPSRPNGRADDAIAAARVVEWTVLSGTGFDAALARAGVALAPISRIMAKH